LTSPAEGTDLPAGSGEQDVVGSRPSFILIGMASAFVACVVFAIARLAVTVSSGRLTPWWANAGGAVAIAILYLWFRRAAPSRSHAAAHGTALVATVALLVPVAYGMPSTIWWLSLVGFAMVLLGRRREAVVWGVAIPVLVVLATLGEPYVQVPGSAGEPPIERHLARVVFVVLLVGMAAAFRRVTNERATALARASAARSRFLAHVSHEIRTPLHGVLSMTELALGSDLPDEARQKVETARQSGQVLLALLNNVLDLTRAESDALELEEKPFPLHSALGEVLRPLAAQARGQGLTFSATASPGLAELRRGDRYRVSQIALNLIGNALKFTPEGSIAVRLAADPSSRDRVILTVEDTGTGIAPDLAKFVFAPFSQGMTARASGGAGLGLAIVQELARRMGGRATVESDVGRGSRFTVWLTLPVEPDAAPGPEDLLTAGAPSGPHAPPRATGATTKLKVLVCEDDPVNQLVLCAMLRKLGHDVSLVAAAEEAWRALLAERYDLLLTDIEMPGMDGLELTRKLRTREREKSLPRLPIVAGTAHVGPDERHRLHEAGVDSHLPKPFTLGELEKTVSQVVAAVRNPAARW
jgi:signal transduction histidine kinase/ActR/RegA family two-component response regulator